MVQHVKVCLLYSIAVTVMISLFLDINECSTNAHDCEHLCVNVIGSFNCTCQLGFLLSTNGRDCVG